MARSPALPAQIATLTSAILVARTSTLTAERVGRTSRIALSFGRLGGVWRESFSLPPDRLILALLSAYGFLVFAVLLFAPIRFLLAEDAIILHQYSKNLALHGAITYYAGGQHTEGATDFGWMLLLAAATRLGLSPGVMTAITNVVSLCLLALTLIRLANLKAGFRHVLAIAGAAGMFPQILASLSGFAILPEALLLTLLVKATNEKKVVLAPALALTLCLFRPDGALFAIPLLLSLLLDPGDRTYRAKLFIGLFLLPGILYFAWRAWYFRAFLPLPFLVKADVHRFWHVLVLHSFTVSLKYILLDAVLLVPLWRRLCARPSLIVSLLIAPTVFYWGMRLDQDVGDRFFFYLPLSAAIVIAMYWNALQQNEKRFLLRSGLCAFALFLLGPLLREVRSFRDYQFRNVREIARGLRHAPLRGSMLISEAGYLAYDSDWIAGDAWGLNTSRFARHFIQPGDVLSLLPDLIVLHPDLPGDCSPGTGWPEAYADRTWEHMIRNVVLGVQSSGNYDQWYIPYGSEYYQSRKHFPPGKGDQECVFLKRTSPDYQFMVTLLRAHQGTQ